MGGTAAVDDRPKEASVIEVEAALAGYEVVGELGRGAMGEVLGGRHIRLGRDVAIKRLPEAFAQDPEVRERFGEEARLLASLNHPHIVPVYDYVEQDGLCLLVMESLPAGTVWDRFTGEGMTMPASCAVALATCTALSYAHEQLVLHRDIKPENLMFDAEGSLKVTDFGIAQVLGGDETLATVDGDVIGTPAYMAPEQAAGQAVGPAADVYAVATMLYELFSARLPFDESGGVTGILDARINEDPTPIQDVAPNVPAPLARVTMEGLARDPAHRPDSAEAFGVAVGTAATDVWGPDWINTAGLKLMGSGAIARSTQRLSSPPPSTPPSPGSTVAAPPGDGDADVHGTRVSGRTPPAGDDDREVHGTRVSGRTPPAGGDGDVDLHGTRISDRTPPAGDDGDVDVHGTRISGRTPPAGDDGDVDVHGTRTSGRTPPAGDDGDVDVHGTRISGRTPPAAEPPGDESVAPDETESVVGQDVAVRPDSVVRRGDGALRRGGDLGDVDPADFVPVHEVLSPPPVPRGAIAGTVIALLFMVIVAVVGVGSPSRGGDLSEGQVQVNGQDVAAGDPVTVNLAEQVVIDVDELPPGAEDAEAAELRLSAGGVDLGTSTAGELPALGSGTTDVGARSLRVITSGEVTADLRFLDESGAVVESYQFPLDIDQPWYLTAAALGGLLLLVFAAAYAVSVATPLWLGRQQRSSGIALTWLGGVGGLIVLALVWAAGGAEPTLLTTVVVVLLGAVAGAAGSWSLFRLRRRRRILNAAAEAMGENGDGEKAEPVEVGAAS